MTRHVMIDKRTNQRHRVLKAGKISFGQAGIIDCVVRNMSDTGARLEVESVVGIPDSFNLMICADRYAKQCRVVWRKEKQIGIKFVA